MILQRLAEHYDRIAASNKDETQLAPPGFSRQKISFCVVLNSDGSLNDIHSLQEQVGKKLIALEKIVPGQTKSSGSGLNPCFLWDTSSYMLGYKINDQNSARTNKEFEAFCEYHLSLQDKIANPAFDAVCKFLRSWTPSEAHKYEEKLSKYATHRGIFKIAGISGYVHEMVAEPKKVTKVKKGRKQKRTTGICLVTGEEENIAVLHKPEIKGVRGTRGWWRSACIDELTICMFLRKRTGVERSCQRRSRIPICQCLELAAQERKSTRCFSRRQHSRFLGRSSKRRAGRRSVRNLL